MPYDFDIIVVGSGAGGATFAVACAAAGKSVLLVERGHRHAAPGPDQDERAALIEKRPYDDRTVTVNGRPLRLYVGGGLGGSTGLYGAARLRPSAADFHPGRHYGSRLPRAVWDWPISYEALERYYDRAEELYGVAGPAGEDLAPLGRPLSGYPGGPLPLHPINQRLLTANQARGLKPFRLPLAIDFRRCLHCAACPGYVCPTGARQSSAHLIDRATGGRLRVLTGVEAEALVRGGGGRVEGVRLRDRAGGQTSFYRARRYALAAGAIHSPALLLRSGLGGPLVGRHYMAHLAPVVAGVFARPTGAESTFIKQLGFADYYFGTPRFPHKLGVIQSLPVPGPLMLAKSGAGRLPRSLAVALRRRLLPLMGIVEDLPNPANRITVGADGRAELRHCFAPYDKERGRRLAGHMGQILKRAGAAFCLTKPFTSEEHAAHQCGTLRFGRSPDDAVADPDGRLFGQPDVFVVDGSVFPTSLGVGPALTIMANALRVADVVAKEV